MASKLLFACFLVIVNMEIGHGGEFANVTLVQSGVQEGAGTYVQFHYQLQTLITPHIGGGADEWYKCLFKNLTFCNSTQLEIMREFHETFIQALYDLDSSPSRGLGMFIHTCYQHGHIYTKLFWKCSCVMDIVLNNKTIADAVGDWYFDRPNAFQLIDTSHSLPQNCTPTLENDAFNKKCLQLIG